MKNSIRFLFSPFFISVFLIFDSLQYFDFSYIVMAIEYFYFLAVTFIFFLVNFVQSYFCLIKLFVSIVQGFFLPLILLIVSMSVCLSFFHSFFLSSPLTLSPTHANFPLFFFFFLFLLLNCSKEMVLDNSGGHLKKKKKKTKSEPHRFEICKSEAHNNLYIYFYFYFYIYFYCFFLIDLFA